MEEDLSHMTEKILNLTLEIIYLLTGERFPLEKHPDNVTTTIPMPQPLTIGKHNKQKILEVINKMTPLLTGESDYNIVIKEEYNEEDEDYGVIKSSGYSQDSTQEDRTIPHHNQGEDLKNVKVEGETEKTLQSLTLEIIFLLTGQNLLLVKLGDQMTFTLRQFDSMILKRKNVEKILEVTNRMIDLLTGESEHNINIKEEYKAEDEQYGVMEERDSTQEGLTTPHHDQSEDLNIKVESDIEYKEEPEIIKTIINEDTPSLISAGQTMAAHSKDYLTINVDGEMEDEDDSRDGLGEIIMTRIMDDGENQGEETFSCPECDESFSSEQCLSIHQRSHTEKKPFFCAECEKYFICNSQLIRHQRSHTGEKPYCCPECGQCFSLKSNLSRHQKFHTGAKPFSCLECGKSYTRKLDLVMHQSSHAGEKPYSCSECGQCFSSEQILSVHQVSHAKEKTHSCPLCGESFAYKHLLNIHKRSHMGRSLHACTECKKAFFLESALVRHQKSHKLFSCTKCGQKFIEKSDFLKHKVTHFKEKLYSCPECGKSFPRNNDLVRHRLSHTGERPYPCPECGKCFSCKSQMTRHQRSHTGVKPHSCPECGKSYTERSHLAKHQRTHTEVSES